jgi:hypothetical protein
MAARGQGQGQWMP